MKILERSRKCKFCLKKSVAPVCIMKYYTCSYVFSLLFFVMKYFSLLWWCVFCFSLLWCSWSDMPHSDQQDGSSWLALFQAAFDACWSAPETCSSLEWESLIEWEILSLLGEKKEVMLFGWPDSDDWFQVSLQENKTTLILVTDPNNNSVVGSDYLKEWMKIALHTRSFHKSEKGRIVEKYGQFYWIQVVGE